MKIFHDIEGLNAATNKKLVATIGNFDGVHIGHQFLIRQILSSKHSTEKLVIITFNPHPEFVIHDQENYLISSYENKYEYLAQLGVSFVVEVKFDQKLRNLNPEEFFKKYILEIKDLTHFYFGEDFSLGKDRCFNVVDAKKLLAIKNIESKIISKKLVNDLKVSSTLIRKCIAAADFKKAEKLLGRQYEFSAEVIQGKKIGRSLGFNTANLIVRNYLRYPPSGVYAVRVKLKGEEYPGAMNIGFNPTISDNNEVKIEVHLIDFIGELYGQELKIIPVQKIREEMRFATLEELKYQIQKDITTIRELLRDD